jgi:hypothetical protein
VGGLRVVRTPACLGVAEGDRDLFCRLQRIFPILRGWVPVTAAEWLPDEDPTVEGKFQPPGRLENLPVDSHEEARYDLAQSVLLLNVSGKICEATLIDAAMFSVPCIGASGSRAQQALWPELAADNDGDALQLARMLLTNAAMLRRLAAKGRANCKTLYAPDEAGAATWLRRLHAARTPARTPAVMTGTR